MAQMRALMPDSGVYLNECAFSEPDWQQVRTTPPLAPARPSRKLGSQHQWGEQYPRLLEIKRRLDPQGIFLCHHCVGSEGRA